MPAGGQGGERPGTVVEVVDDQALLALMRSIAAGDDRAASGLLAAQPQLAVARLVAVGATRAAAVEFFLDGGADPRRSNDRGSTAIMLAGRTTGRGGSGSPEAKAAQAEIVSMLVAATADR